MMVSVMGECDTRPVLYTLMKICQGLGDVLLITGNRRLLRMVDTHASGGHVQNVMVGIADEDEGVDDFFEDFPYDIEDFEYIIADNLLAAETNCIIYARGLIQSETEESQLTYVDKYEVIDVFKSKLSDNNTLIRCEEFETLQDFCTINNKLTAEVAKVIAEYFRIDAGKLTEIGNAQATNKRISTLPSTKPKKGLLGKVGGMLGV